MLVFTESVLQGIGTLSVVPMPLKRRRLKSRFCSNVGVRISERKEISLLGTELFSKSPWTMDWWAVGNDVRLAVVKYQLEAGANGQEEIDQSGQSQTNRNG